MAPDGGGLIVEDPGYALFDMFNSQNGFPSFAFVDHNMTVYLKVMVQVLTQLNLKFKKCLKIV